MVALCIGFLCIPGFAVAECYPAGKTSILHEMSFLDRATLGPGGSYVLVESTRAPMADVFELSVGQQFTIRKPRGTILKFIGEHDVAFESGGKWTAVNLVSHKKRLLNTMEIAAQTSAANMANSLPLTATLPIAGGSHIKNAPIFGGLSLLELETDRWLCAESDPRRLSVSETASVLQNFARPGGFSNASDLAKWMAIVQAHKGSLGLISASLLGILVKSPELFEALSTKVGGRAVFSQLDQKFLTKQEKATIAGQVQSYLVQTFKSRSDIHFNTLKHYAPLIRAVSNLENKNELVEIVGYLIFQFQRVIGFGEAVAGVCLGQKLLVVMGDRSIL